MSDDPAVRALLPHLCPAWHGEFREKVARSIVAANRAYGLALDSRSGRLDRAVHRFFHGGDQMPMTTTPTSAIPAGSHGDTRYHTGGTRFRQRGGDQSNGVSVQQLLDYIVRALQEMTDDEANAFVEGLGGLLDSSALDPAEDQGSSMRLPDNGGTGSDPADFFNQSTAGSFSERDAAWRGIGTPPGADNGPTGQPGTPARLENLPPGMVARELQRRGANDRRSLAQDSRQRARNTEGFLSRFPMAGRIEIWG